MKITCLLGSARAKGNSSTLAKRFTDRAQELGAEVQTFSLNKLDFKGCQGCLTCKTKTDKCVLKDDLAEVLEAVRETDVLVMASPVYWMDINAQLKTFIDRTFSFLVSDYLTADEKSRLDKGKKTVFILTQGWAGGQAESVHDKYKAVFGTYLGMECDKVVHAPGVRYLGDIDEREDFLALADKAAEELFA